MKAIYKYPVPVDDTFTLVMPKGAVILSVQEQHGEVQLWALVDTEPLVGKHERTFRLAGTGHPILDDHPLVYISTFQLHRGSLVFHVFEVMK